MALNFDKYVHDGKQFVKEVADELGTPDDLARGGRMLRAVLHTFRNRVPPAESLELISQLPMLIKAIYVDGWQISDESKHLRHFGDFIEAVREAGGAATHDDFTTDYEVEQVVRAVFRIIKRHVSRGEIRDVLATLPEELWQLLPVSSRSRRTNIGALTNGGTPRPRPEIRAGQKKLPHPASLLGR